MNMQRPNLPDKNGFNEPIQGVYDRAGVLVNFNNPFEQQFRMPVADLPSQYDQAQQSYGTSSQMNGTASHINGTARQFNGTTSQVNGTAAQLNGLSSNSYPAMINPALSNSDLSPSKFNQAMTFESQNARMDAQLGILPQAIAGMDNFMKQSSDNTGDVMEQAQAMEQAKAMERFKQLREMQVQQQQLLMLQQQQQLEHIRAEQAKVQRMLAKQRGAQWGDPSRNGLIPNVPNLPAEAEIPNMHTPKKSTMGSIPQALALGAMLQAKKNRHLMTQNSHNQSNDDVQVGIPLPHIVDSNTPEFQKERVNPDLDSDPDTRSLSSITDEGVFPLPDTASESSGQTETIHKVSWSNQPTSSTPNHFSAGLLKEKLSQENASINFVPNSLQQTGYITGNNEVKDQTNIYNVSNLQTSNMQMRNLPTFQGDPLVKITDGPVSLSDSIIGQLAQELGMNPADVAHVVQNLPVSNEQLAKYVEQGDISSDNGDTESSRDEMAEDQMEDIPEEEDDDEYVTDEDAEDMNTENNRDTGEAYNAEEDRPITGLGAKKKTFEELLEEELRMEEEKLREKTNAEQVESQEDARKVPFLRKGQGLARFSGKKIQPKVVKKNSTATSRKTAKSQNVVQTSNKQQNTVKHQNSTAVNKPSVSGAQKKYAGSSSTDVKGSAVVKNLPVKSVTQPVSTSPKDKKKIKTNKKLPSSIKSALDKRVASLKLKPVPPKPKVTGKLDAQKEDLEVDHEEPTENDTIGDISYQNKMVALEEKSEIEKDELVEFEILEKYADDNASFLSNVSMVKHVVQSDKDKVRDVKVPAHANSEEYDSQMIETAVQEISEDTDIDETLEIDSSSSSDGSDTETEDLLDTIHKNDVLKGINSHENSVNLQSLRVLQRKVATIKKSPNTTGDSQLNKVDLDSVSEKSDIDIQHKINENRIEVSHNNQDLNNNNNSSQSASGTASAEIGSSSNSMQSQKENSLVKPLSVRQAIVFEDEQDSWGDNSVSDDIVPLYPKPVNDVTSDSDTASSHQKMAKSPVKQDNVAKQAFVSSNVSNEVKESPPPTSKLVQKLFPKLREEKPKPKTEPEQEQKLQAAQRDIGEGVQSRALQLKLAELENEIERFRSENAKLEKLRIEREEGVNHLKKEVKEFEQLKDEELKRIQEFKAEEMKKIRKERKIFDQYQRAMKAGHDKKEREEIETLKNQLTDLQEEVKRKESRWTASTKRLRDRIELLENENTELKEEVKMLEKKRLEAWQKDLSEKKKDDIKKQSAPPKQDMPAVRNSAENAVKVNNSAAMKDRFSDEASMPSKSKSPTAARAEFPEIWTPPPDDSTSSPSVSPKKEVPPKKTIPRKRAFRFSITNTIDKGDEQYEELQHTDGKVEKVYKNGAREILFSNGTRKQISADGQSIIVSFFNGDIKQIMPDQRVVYYYSDGGTTHTTYPDGLEILQFPNNQVEKHYPDGTREISFPDQTIKYLFPNGTEESIFPDGTVIREDKDGIQTMEFANGQREIHTKQYMRREYPDGTVKTLYPDGRQETKYSTGRVRIKDKAGNVLVDTKM